MTAGPPVDDDRVTDLLCACDDALAGGTFPIVSGDVPSNELQPRVERGVAFLVRLQQLRASPPASASRQFEAIGRFILRRQLGRGGFGVVYLAFDPRLGREVALKVPHAGALTEPELRLRFQAEAQTAAGLDHPNLVSVFEAGEAGDICYLVCSYCCGGTLADWLRDRRAPVAPADAAGLIETLARAVQYAHERGVLHRDLKPANILLQKTEDNGQQAKSIDDAGASSVDCPLSSRVPKIADFGLAKRLAALGPETRTGTFIGTPSYMAPEQAVTNGAVGPATDVYALGAILYECLTGRPPFQGDGPLDTLEQVRSVDPVPPRRLRPKLPRDLETICLRALEKQPDRRYRTAGQLADDLGRFRAGEPIAARRIGPAGRAWRWGKRRPVVAALVAALVTSVVGGVSAVVWQWRRAESNAIAMREQRDLADRERLWAQANLRRAGLAVRAMTAAGRELFHQKGHEDAGRKIIERAAAFHEGFVAEQGDVPAVLLDAARGWAEAAMIRASLGQINLAIAANDRCIELYDRLLIADPANRDHRLERAKRLRSGAYYHSNWEQDDAAAERDYAEAQAAFESLSAEVPDYLGYRYHLANTLVNHGVLLGGKGQVDRAISLFERAIDLQSQAVVVAPNDRGWQVELALSREALGNLLWKRDRSVRGDKLCREALESFRKLVAADPAYRDGRWFALRATSSAGDRAAEVGRLADANRDYREALTGLAGIRADFPRSVAYAAEQAWDVIKLADLTRKLDRIEKADDLYRQATHLAERLSVEFPDEMISQRLRPVTAHLHYADFLNALGRTKEAVAVLNAARKLWPSDAEVADALRRFESATSGS